MCIRDRYQRRVHGKEFELSITRPFGMKMLSKVLEIVSWFRSLSKLCLRFQIYPSEVGRSEGKCPPSLEHFELETQFSIDEKYLRMVKGLLSSVPKLKSLAIRQQEAHRFWQITKNLGLSRFSRTLNQLSFELTGSLIKDLHISRMIVQLSNLKALKVLKINIRGCLLYTSPSPRDRQKSRMPSSA
eukprot:TRINITY_DN24876_c0_g1_i1.p1 TRINITY_DN24876_c0_g1~~TRINITY_DN24876_c0_g1_i1.p1  ORF type:complete len:186 (+),score=33.25 TRINITY_DN24876_c0_g1_i1:63-620(+)